MCGQDFGLGREDMLTLLLGDEVELVALISNLQKNNRILDSVCRHKANLLCLFRAFLLVSGYVNRGHAMLLSVVKEVHPVQTPMSLIVADTILLGRLYHHPS